MWGKGWRFMAVAAWLSLLAGDRDPFLPPGSRGSPPDGTTRAMSA